MFKDFTSFLLLYCILAIMFAIIGNLNFAFQTKQHHGLFEAALTVLDASVGIYDFNQYFDILHDEELTVFGGVFTMAIVITFNILILNLIIAILSNTYNMFYTKSTGLYLSKVLNAREDMNSDPYYGGFLLSMTPLNVVILPFMPVAIFGKPSKALNLLLSLVQYSVFITVVYALFLAGSVGMVPFAFLKGVGQKLSKFLGARGMVNTLKAGVQMLLFLAYGLPVLCLGLLSDLYYFWANNFRTNL